MSQIPNQPPYRPGQAGQPQPNQPQPGQPYYTPQPSPQPYHQPQMGQPTPSNLPYPPIYSQPATPTPQSPFTQPIAPTSQPTFAQSNFTSNAQVASFQKSLATFLAYSFLVVGQIPFDTGQGRLNVLGVLADIASLCGAIAVYWLEKENQFVRYHALQALTLGICWIVLTLLVEVITFQLLAGLTSYIQVILFIIYIYIIAATIYRVSCRNENYQIPIVGKITQFIRDPEA